MKSVVYSHTINAVHVLLWDLKKKTKQYILNKLSIIFASQGSYSLYIAHEYKRKRPLASENKDQWSKV